MGCIFGKPEQRGRRIFHVYNVDDSGEELNNGTLEVTDTDVVLYHKGKEIRWPLRCLRRYGWEGDLFSFESGRRCQTGPGIYAFKCKRAELLFNAVQECIRRAGQVVNANQAFDPSAPNSRPNSVIELNDITVRNGTVPSGNPSVSAAADTQNYVNQPDPDQPQYINTKFSKPQSRPVPENNADLVFSLLHEYPQEREQPQAQNYAELEFSSSGDENSIAEGRGNNRHPSARGSDVDCELDGGAEDDADVFLPENPQNDYLNVGVEPGRPPPPKPSLPEAIREVNNSNVVPSRPSDTSNTMIYISVENNSRANGVLPAAQSASAAVPRDSAPQNSGCLYSWIDPDKTIALRESGLKSRDDCDEGIRKTRHNSTFNDK